jgi:hypothetical protein
MNGNMSRTVGQALPCSMKIPRVSEMRHFSLDGGLKVLEGFTIMLYVVGDIRVLEC